MPSLFRRLLLPTGLCLLSACGGSTGYGTGTPGTGGGTVDVTGTWSGSFSVGAGSGTTAIVAVIEKDGPAFFYDQTGVLYVMPKFNGATTVSGTLTAFAPSGITLSNGLSTEAFTFTATVSSTTITGSFTGNSITATFTLAPFAIFTGNASIVAGNWQGFYVGSGTAAVALTVQAGGSFTGNDSSGCHLTGTISTTANNDVFDVSVDSAGGASCAGQLTGLAFESRQDLSGFFGGTTGTYYYLGVSNATGAFVAELKVQ